MNNSVNDQVRIIHINGWKIQTRIDGDIGAYQDQVDGIYEIWVNGDKVVEIGFVQDDLLRVTTKEGYAVQMIISERFISVIEEARSI